MASKAKRLLSQIKKSKTLTEPPLQNSLRMSNPITSTTTTTSNVPSIQNDNNNNKEDEEELDPLSFLSKYSTNVKSDNIDAQLNLNVGLKFTQNNEPTVPKHSFTSKNVSNCIKQNEFNVNANHYTLSEHSVSPSLSCERKQEMMTNENGQFESTNLTVVSNKTVSRCKKYMKCYKDKIIQNRERIEKLNKLTQLFEEKYKGKKMNIKKIERIMNELLKMKIDYIKDNDVQNMEVFGKGKCIKRKLDMIEIEMLMS